MSQFLVSDRPYSYFEIRAHHFISTDKVQIRERKQIQQNLISTAIELKAFILLVRVLPHTMPVKLGRACRQDTAGLVVNMTCVCRPTKASAAGRVDRHVHEASSSTLPTTNGFGA